MMKFTNFVPGRVTKLDKYKIKRIAIKDGKFMAFMVDDVAPNENEDDDLQSVERPPLRYAKDSQIDTEEEMDIVPSKIASSKQSNHSRRSSALSHSSFKFHSKKAKVDGEILGRYEILREVMARAKDIQSDLFKFDRLLADSMKPLLDCNNETGGLYVSVIDRFVDGKHTTQDAEELRMAIDRMQIQFKINADALAKIDAKIKERVTDYVSEA